MSEKLYRIKPLVWRKIYNGDVEASSWIASYSVYKNEGNGWRWGYCADEYYDEDDFSCDSREHGMAQAEAHYRARLMDCLEEVK